MIEIGYALSSEEHNPIDLVRYAQRAEKAGFKFAYISDHYHPWIDRQGQSPFVWNVIGGIASATKKLRLGTGVTCPIMRIHPAIIAQAAATSAAMMPGRFVLGVGTGEALNEHILGDHWPPADVRLEMLEEAVQILRILWGGEEESFYGDFFTVENARLYTMPEVAPPVFIAAAGPESAEVAGEIGDGLISTSADPELVRIFEAAGGKGKPKVGQVSVVWAENERDALNTAFTYWPTATVPESLHADLPTPAHFGDTVEQYVKEEDLTSSFVLGPDPSKHIEKIQEMVEAGFNQVYIHQIGPNQEGFFRFYEKEVLPKLTDLMS